MEILRPNGLTLKADRYFRRTDTFLARVANVAYSQYGADYINSRGKRVFDLSIGIPSTIVAAPIIAGLSITKRIEDGGSAFFIEQRLDTKLGNPIDIVKIRCMTPNADAKEGNLNIARGLEPHQDPRNTHLGRVMRRYQLEELPQLLQVLRGKLSLIGVRPIAQYGVDNLQRRWSAKRFQRWNQAYQSGPLGISGLNQTMGSDLKEDEKRFHLDVFYTKYASLGLDLYLLWKTALTMLGRKLKN